ncbi:c-type cytochrome [Rehaibacterium terrae]
MRNHDLTFLKHFSMAIAFLVLVTIALIYVASRLHGSAPREASPVAEQRTLERIRPAGAVYAGETGAAAMAAAAEAARAAAASQVAFGGSTDGELIYTNACAACHGSGAGGAPKLERAAWNARLAQGMDTLIRHAIEGFQGSAGLMPARGGNPALTDEQVEASVRWMVDHLQ